MTDPLGQLLQGALGSGAANNSNNNVPASGGMDIGALASQFGLSTDQASAAVSALLPAVLGGFSKVEQGGALDQVAAQAGNITAPTTDTAGGNSILGQIFGSKDVSRTVVDHAVQQTGISDTVLKAMLPIVAGLAAQQVAKRMTGGNGMLGGLAGGVLASMLGNSASAQASPAGGLFGGLASMLGGSGNNSGNPLDAILSRMRDR